MRVFSWIMVATLMAILPQATALGADMPLQDFEGHLEILRADDFTTGTSTTTYSLRFSANGSAPTVLQLVFPNGTPEGTWRSGDAVLVRGRRSGAAIQVASLQPQFYQFTPNAADDARSLPEFAPSIEDRKAVIIIVNMLDAANSHTISDVAGFMYENDQNVDDLFKASSFEQIGFNPDTDDNGQPDIFGPFTINHNAADDCNYMAWASSADAAAQANGIDLSIYQHKVYLLPQEASCGWSGLGSVGCGYFCAVWLREGGGPVLAHELGHNLSWQHAGTDPDNDGTLDSEYGDQSGIMGWPRWSQANAPHRDQKQWFDAFPGSLQVANTSGVYELDALELDPGANGVATQVVKIPRNGPDDYYYLSYRREEGDYPVYWRYANKVNIHHNSGISVPTAHIVNLDEGETFTDSANDIVVTVTEAGGARASVTVTIAGTSINVQPTASFDSSVDNLSVTLSDTSSDADGTIVSRSWDFGDGNTSSLSNPTHTYAESGTYIVRLAVTDDDGGTGVDTRSVTTNQMPAAAFEVTVNGMEVVFDSTCTDSDGTVQSQTWDFGDGNGSAEADPVHTYDTPSAYTVTLTARDNDGGTTTLTRVVNLAPNVAASPRSDSGGGSSSGGCFIQGVLQP